MYKQEKLFDFNRKGNLLDTKDVLDTKDARDFVIKMIKNKAMPDYWKLDIFIRGEIDSLSIHKVPVSAAFEKGRFEYSINVNKLDSTFDEEFNYTNPVCYFPTYEKAEESLLLIITFIKYRYDNSLTLNNKFVTYKNKK